MELKRVIKRIWNIRSIKVIPVVEGTLGSTSKKLKNCIELGVVISTALRQEIALLRTAHILRKVLDCRYGLWKRVRSEEKRWGRGRGRERVPKTEQMRKHVKV